MKHTLTKETKLDAWDHIMMGAFQKVFKDYGPKYQKPEVVTRMKQMNFDQVNQVTFDSLITLIVLIIT
jgi:hypothetical protein